MIKQSKVLKSPIKSNDPKVSQKTIPTPITPQEQGESSLSGHMPDPETDDDVLKEAQDEAGLYTEYDDEHQGEVNLDRELDEADEPSNR